MTRSAWLLGFVLVACGVNPLPEPPAPELVDGFSGSTCEVCDGSLRVAGEPGSVVNADSVWIVNLDGTEPPQLVPVASDGSFEVFVFAGLGDELRLQARRDDERSVPRDFVATFDAELDEAPRPFADCFVVGPELEIGDDGAFDATDASVTLTNDCTVPLTLDSIDLRVPHVAFQIDAPTTPLVLEPGEEVVVGVRFTPPDQALQEEVLLVEVSSPETDRRPITLYGRGD